MNKKSLFNWIFCSNVPFNTYKYEIDGGRPNVLSFRNQSYYGQHSVTGVGYKEYIYSGVSIGHQYMRIHDNWSSTTGYVYIAYGRNYSCVVMSTFKPE